MILNDIFRAWLSSNNDLAKTLKANTWKSFHRLLENVQSTPLQSMNHELELTVALNLCVSAWLRNDKESSFTIAKTVTSTVKRVTNTINVNKVIGHNFNDVFQALTSINLYQHLSKTSLDIVLTLLSFIILFSQLEETIIQQFLSFSIKIKKSLRELDTGNLCDEEMKPKRLSLQSKAGHEVQYDHALLGHLIAAKYGLGPEDCEYEGIDHLHATLLRAAGHQQQDAVLALCDRAHQRRQTEAVNSLGLLMEGQLLLKENKIHGALSVFKTIIQKEPENEKAYVAIARCFEIQGKKRQEIETLKILCKIQHFKKCNQSNSGMMNLEDRIIETLLATEPQSYERSLLTLARKCFESGDMVTSSERYLDTLALLEGGEVDLDEDRDVIYQEAVLSLMIIKKYEDCMTLCKYLQEVETVKKRKSRENSYFKLITNFLVGKVYYHLAELRPAIKNLDVSLQACRSLSTEGQNKQKRRKLDTDSLDANSEEGGSSKPLSDPQIVLMLMSRLYFEKSQVLKQLGDLTSQSTALKFSLRLHFSDPVHRIYSELQGRGVEEQGLGLDTAAAKPQSGSDNLCLQFLTDFSNVGKV